MYEFSAAIFIKVSSYQSFDINVYYYFGMLAKAGETVVKDWWCMVFT